VSEGEGEDEDEDEDGLFGDMAALSIRLRFVQTNCDSVWELASLSPPGIKS
jgi:hypothetical protein